MKTSQSQGCYHFTVTSLGQSEDSPMNFTHRTYSEHNTLMSVFVVVMLDIKGRIVLAKRWAGLRKNERWLFAGKKGKKWLYLPPLLHIGSAVLVFHANTACHFLAQTSTHSLSVGCLPQPLVTCCRRLRAAIECSPQCQTCASLLRQTVQPLSVSIPTIL